MHIQRGFTIVELLIVIIVIAVLASITVVAFSGVSTRAVNSVVQTDLRNASMKMNRYHIEKGTWPLSWGEAVPPGQFGGTATEEYAIRVSKRSNFINVTGPTTSQNALVMCGYGKPVSSPTFFGPTNSHGLILTGISAKSQKVFAVMTENNTPIDITSYFDPSVDSNVCVTAGRAFDVKIGFQWYMHPYVGVNSN